jgi:tetratricopeptide (TPR) repeat protein
MAIAVYLVWLLGTAIVPVTALAGDAGEEVLLGDFAEGNSLYEQGDYEGAIAKYNGLVAAGVEHKSLYYNLANAHYRNDDLGASVLFYERALRLSPRDEDTRANLALVRSQLKDKQFVQQQNRLVAGAVWLHNNTSTGEMTLVASVSYVVLCLLVIIFVLRGRDFVAAIYDRVSVVSPGRLLGLTRAQDLALAAAVVFIVFSTSSASAYMKIERDRKPKRAVVMAAEIPVFSGPTGDATLQFKIHEGTIVAAEESREGWVRVRLPGGLAGWIEGRSIQRI